MTLLLLVIFIIVFVVFKVWLSMEAKNSMVTIAEELERMFLFKFFRMFMLAFQYLYVPVIIPIAVYIIRYSHCPSSKFMSITIMVLTPLVYYLIEYHQLELDHTSSYQLSRKNFPNNIYDGMLVYTHGIIIILL